jgi:hypothetical protein
MSRGLGSRQRQLLGVLQTKWDEGHTLVRLLPAGVAENVRRRILGVARRLERRNLVVLIKTWDKDSLGRQSLVIYAAPPGGRIYSEMQQKEIAVEELKVLPSNGIGVEEIRSYSRACDRQGVHLTDMEAGKALADKMVDTLSIDERIRQVQAKINEKQTT